MRQNLLNVLAILTKPAVALGGATVISLIAVGYAYQMKAIVPSGQYAKAVLATITAVGGASSDLSFQIAGQVTSIPVKIGSKVSTGDSLVVLDRSALFAARAGAVANQEAAQARLDALKAGTRSEQISVYQTAVTQGQEALRDAVRSAYINADDAVHNKVDQFFLNPRTSSAELAFTVPDQTLQNRIKSERVALENVLTSWGAQVNTPDFATAEPLVLAKAAQENLAQVASFLDTAAQVLAKNPTSSTLSLATVQGYQTSINTARLNVSGSVTAITSSLTALVGAQGTLKLAQAGSTANDVAAAQAAVDATQATLSGIDVTIYQSTLRSPVAGTITALNARLGQTVAPNQVLVSVESSGGSKKNVLVVPSSSIITTNGESFVFVKNADAPLKTVVTTGLVGTNGTTEIISGLSAGDEVLTFGATNE